MSTTLLFLLIALALLAAFAILAARRTKDSPNLDQTVAAIRSLDVAAFRNIVDPGEEDFLRDALPPREFRKVKRERARAALAYVRALSDASLLFTRIGDAAQRSPDPALVASGRQIANSAVYLRLRVLDASTRLKLSIAFPDLPPRPLRSLLDHYDRATYLMLKHNGLRRVERRAA